MEPNSPSSPPSPDPGARQHAPRPPLLVYDGDCGLCTRLATRYRARAGAAVRVLPGVALGPGEPPIPAEVLARSVVFVDEAGRRHEGAAAVTEALARAGRTWPRALYRRVPGLAPVAEALYRLVARHRHRLPGSTCTLADAPRPPTPRDDS